MQKADGGSRSCWRRTVRKPGSTQDGQIPCRNGTNGWSNMKKKAEKSEGDASAKCGEDDHECRRECWTSSQNHKANDVGGGEEYRSWGKRRKTRNCWSAAKQKEKNGQHIGNATRRYRMCKTCHGGMWN